MDNKDLIQERISSLIDGELAEAHVPAALGALNRPEERGTWDRYHQIGDILRSDDMALSMSPGFMSALSARLDAEPTVIAPAGMDVRTQKTIQSSTTFVVKRFALPSIAIAASVAALIFITSPQALIATKDAPQDSASTTMVASASYSAGGSDKRGTDTSAQQDGVILRDPQIDQYLSAHQRFSPSAYSFAQYARSANFASDSGK